MISNGGFPENLAVLARRGALTKDEQFELERLVESSATLRAALVVGQDFDRIAAVQAGDEVRIARSAAAVLEARKRRRVVALVRRSRRGWLLVAAVLSVCGVAYGLRGVYWPKVKSAQSTSTQESGQRIAPMKQTRRDAPAVTRRESEATTEENVTSDSPDNALVQRREDSSKFLPPKSSPASSAQIGSEPAVLAPPGSSNAVHPQSSGAFVDVIPTDAGPAALLRRANIARSQGNSKLAVSIFRELQQTYPSTPEAGVSHVSLGKLLAAGGAADEALKEFTTYLTIGGPLAEEALFSRAQVLATLGRRSEEQIDLQALIARFPGSVYTAKAKERLQVLSHGTNR